MQLRDHEAKLGRVDAFKLDPRAIKIDAAHNIRDMQSPETREHIEELKIQIRSDGVKKPLEVRMVGDDIFVTDGECRLTAVLELIRDENFPIVSVMCLNEAQGMEPLERTLNFGFSGTSKRYTPLEMAEWCRRADRLGASHEKIAAAAGWKAASSVKQHLDLLAMPEPVKEQVRNGDISASLAAKVVNDLPTGTDPEFAAKLIADMKEENRKSGVGAKNNHRVTPKNVNRRKQDAKPSPKPAPDPEPMESVVAPVSRISENRTDEDRGNEIVLATDDRMDAPSVAPAQPPEHLPAAPQLAMPNAAPPRPFLHASIAMLVDAIRPFAVRVADLDPETFDDVDIFISDHVGNITMGQLRAAWRALQAVTGGGEHV